MKVEDASGTIVTETTEVHSQLHFDANGRYGRYCRSLLILAYESNEILGKDTDTH